MVSQLKHELQAVPIIQRLVRRVILDKHFVVLKGIAGQQIADSIIRFGGSSDVSFHEPTRFFSKETLNAACLHPGVLPADSLLLSVFTCFVDRHDTFQSV